MGNLRQNLLIVSGTTWLLFCLRRTPVFRWKEISSRWHGEGINGDTCNYEGILWIGRWREDVIVNGEIKRVLGWNPLGTIKDYPTRKLALRALEDRLLTINNVSYRPRTGSEVFRF